jgi:hypothetical protein
VKEVIKKSEKSYWQKAMGILSHSGFAYIFSLIFGFNFLQKIV